MTAAAAEPRSNGLLHWLKKEALPLLVMLGLLAAARDSLANHYQVPSGSMQPTLQPGDRVVVSGQLKLSDGMSVEPVAQDSLQANLGGGQP